MTSDTRPIWLTRDELTAILCVYFGQTVSPYADSVLNRLEAAWDAAPADATEAVDEVFRRKGLPPYTSDVLRALGMPDPQPETTEPLR